MGKKSLYIATQDKNDVLLGVTVLEDGWKVLYYRNFFTSKLCTDRQILYGVDANSAGA